MVQGPEGEHMSDVLEERWIMQSWFVVTKARGSGPDRDSGTGSKVCARWKKHSRWLKKLYEVVILENGFGIVVV